MICQFVPEIFRGVDQSRGGVCMALTSPRSRNSAAACAQRARIPVTALREGHVRPRSLKAPHSRQPHRLSPELLWRLLTEPGLADPWVYASVMPSGLSCLGLAQYLFGGDVPVFKSSAPSALLLDRHGQLIELGSCITVQFCVGAHGQVARDR